MRFFRHKDLPKVLEALSQSFGHITVLEELIHYLRYVGEGSGLSPRTSKLVHELEQALANYRKGE